MLINLCWKTNQKGYVVYMKASENLSRILGVVTNCFEWKRKASWSSFMSLPGWVNFIDSFHCGRQALCVPPHGSTKTLQRCWLIMVWKASPSSLCLTTMTICHLTWISCNVNRWREFICSPFAFKWKISFLCSEERGNTYTVLHQPPPWLKHPTGKTGKQNRKPGM